MQNCDGTMLLIIEGYVMATREHEQDQIRKKNNLGVIIVNNQDTIRKSVGNLMENYQT